MNTLVTFSQQANAMRLACALRPITLIAGVTLFILISDNSTFWSIAVEVFQGHSLSLAAYSAAVYCLSLAAFSMFAFPYVVKPFLVFLVILAAATSYYMDRLGVMIDRDMIQNVMVTTMTESKHLITNSFILHIGLFGGLPALLICGVKIKHQAKTIAFALPVLTSVLCLAVTAAILISDLKTYSSILRERKDFMGSYQPGAPLVGAIRYAKMVSRNTNVVVAPLGQDAVKGHSYAIRSKPVLTILVAGETARSQNFSLNGYPVDTNPELAKLPVVSFTDVQSCGTATAVSLPCMFSNFGRDTYSYEKGISHENLLDVLTYAGVKVEWWDNNTGHKGIANRIPSRSFTRTKDPEFCAAGECMDGIFMQALKEYAAGITQDTVLVLHQIGSHGPTYYLRYPEQLEPFKPACRTAEFKKCSAMEITNAYDNTIAYTDKMLAETIRFLQSQDGLDTSLLYVSDHGESLGESGLYLHGSPYFMAPVYQTKVPMILWMSDGFRTRFSFDEDCLAEKKDRAFSHENLFHSVLGMLDINTKDYSRALDIFASCKNAQKVATQ